MSSVAGVMAASAATGTAVTAAVTLIVGVAGGGSLVALLRVKVDKDRIVVDAAQGAVVVQTGVITELRAELNRLREEIDRLQAGREADRVKLGRLQAAYDADKATWQVERDNLRRRVARVEEDAGE